MIKYQTKAHPAREGQSSASLGYKVMGFYMLVIIVSIGIPLMENRSRMGEMQMRRIVSKYELGDLLGRGAYSEVFQARHLQEGKLYAVKVISNRVLAENAKVKEYISNQLAIHNVLEPCANIVRFHELLQTKNNCYFVYQYCEGGTLHQLIQKEGPLDEKRAMSIFTQLVEGLKVLRKHNVMHRDLKPENVLIKEGHFKLADFGFCKELGGQCMTRTMLGSPLYMAPEVLRGEAYTVNADIWSIGVILYEMLYGRCPFQSNSIAALISTIDDSLPAFDPAVTVTADTKKFITRCLQKDCRMRIAWEELFDEAKRLIEKSNNLCFSPSSSLSASNGFQSSQHSFLKSLTKVNSKQQSLTEQPSNARTNRSKSKYQIFKQNYNKLTDIKHENQPFDSLKTKQSMGRSSDLHPKGKPHGAKSYNQIVSEHEICWKMLKCVLEKLESRDTKVYPHLCHILKVLRRVLDGIYTRINLDNQEMLPVLSIVKYQLIQIQKVYTEVQKVLPAQISDDAVVQFPLPADISEVWKKVQEVSCL